MGIIGGRAGYGLLRAIARTGRMRDRVGGGDSDTRLTQYFGPDLFHVIQGKTVIDFGCGTGRQAVEMAVKGAGRVIGLDLQANSLLAARELAKQQSVMAHCTFATTTDELADVIISKDAFEHFADPPAILRSMRSLLKPGGFVLAAFGPTWMHPYGGHLFSVFPWAHLLFTEEALIHWRSDFKTDGATRFSEVDGGLNEMTIRRFEEIVSNSPLEFEWIETIPIRGIRLFRHKSLREFGSSLVRCKLVPKKCQPHDDR